MSADTIFRPARLADLPAIVALLADDVRGGRREDATLPLAASYVAAFHSIDASDSSQLVVGEIAGEIVACLQLTFTPGLSYRGGWRATIEGVRVHKGRRSGGIGAALIGHALGLAKARGCLVVQLATNKARADAQRFYKRLGFADSHEGFKLELS